jgi:uncharacterized UPF0146 family protein
MENLEKLRKFYHPNRIISIMLTDFEDLVYYINTFYPETKKIVEVGIGGEDAVYLELKKNPKWEVLAVDIIPQGKTSYGDVIDPDMEIYQGADLIYSLRPPPEIIPHLQLIASAVEANLLIRPLSTDSCTKPVSMRLVNFGRAVMWEEKK